MLWGRGFEFLVFLVSGVGLSVISLRSVSVAAVRGGAFFPCLVAQRRELERSFEIPLRTCAGRCQSTNIQASRRSKGKKPRLVKPVTLVDQQAHSITLQCNPVALCRNLTIDRCRFRYSFSAFADGLRFRAYSCRVLVPRARDYSRRLEIRLRPQVA